MFPSRKDPTYGTFVNQFYENAKLHLAEVKVDLCVINCRYKGFFKILSYIWFYLRQVCLILLGKYDLLYIHYITHSSVPLILLSKFISSKLAFNIHGGDLIARGRSSEILFDNIVPLLRKAKIIVVPSLFFKDVLIKKVPLIDQNKVFVSPSGGVPESFYRENYNKMHTGLIRLGFVSRIDKGKGWDILLKAVSNLRKEGICVDVKIAGIGNEVPLLEKYIEELNLCECVTYLGAIAHNDLPGFYSSLDLFVFPTTLCESLGLVGIEAMASAVPVIGSKIGGLLTYIQDGSNGYLFRPGNVDELADKIQEWNNLPKKEKKNMSLNAYKTALLYRSDVVEVQLFNRLKQII